MPYITQVSGSQLGPVSRQSEPMCFADGLFCQGVVWFSVPIVRNCHAVVAWYDWSRKTTATVDTQGLFLPNL